MTTITASSTLGIELSSLADTNPVVIAADVQISIAGEAVFGSNISWTLRNEGSLTGSTFGVFLGAGGAVANAASATIAGAYDGIEILGGTGIAVNYGNILGTGTSGIGIFLDAGGSITNATTGTLAGVGYGAFIFGGPGTVANYGSIVGSGTASTGIHLSDGGSITNAATATILATHDGVSISGSAGTVTNDGIIAGTGVGGVGISLNAGGTIINAASAAITGTSAGIVVAGHPGTIINYGTIAGIRLNSGGRIIDQPGGTIAGVSIASTAVGTIVLAPGATFTNTVNGGGATGTTLELAAGSAAGTLSGIGFQYTNFPSVIIDSGAVWQLVGSNSIASSQTLTEQSNATVTATGTLTNNGRIVLDPSTMTLSALAGAGTATIATGSMLEVQGAIASGETIVFAGNGASLHLDTPDNATGSVTNFALGETIDLKGITPASVTLSSGHLQFSGGSFPLALSGATKVQALPSSDGTDVTVLCFCANTLVQTPSGCVPVQDLAIGDHVLTFSGAERPIVWVGKGKVLATRGRRSAATPVIVRKGALAPNVPNQDMRLTKGHALYLDRVLIPVEELVNQRSIEWDDRAQEVEVFHIELETHDVLIANGAPAESYRDDGNRWLFQNAGTRQVRPSPPPYAPIVSSGPIVDTLWQQLLNRAGRYDDGLLTNDPDVHLLLDGRRIDAIERGNNTYAFRLPAQRRHVRICSHSVIPQEFGLARDPRRLGVAVRQIVFAQPRRQRVIGADAASLIDGFHGFEPDNGLRWTNGDAAIPAELFAHMTGPGMLVLHLAASQRYPDSGRRSIAVLPSWPAHVPGLDPGIVPATRSAT